MVFLCGRPGCGRESTATLQIDTPSSTVSLVDPRISRDGVPLCERHADLTTPPMGWTLNDLRKSQRTLAAVPTSGPTITKTPPRSRPSDGDPDEDTKELRPRRRRKVSASNGPSAKGEQDSVKQDRVKQGRVEQGSVEQGSVKQSEVEHGAGGKVNAEQDSLGQDDAKVESSTLTPVAQAEETEDSDQHEGASEIELDAPSSRPKRRREVASDSEESDEDKFPWHHHFEDDEPEELQAKTPLLSRAFRATTG